MFYIIGDCYDKTCNSHGTCQDAKCLCDIGWMGPNCNLRNEVLYQCLPDCSGHGSFNADHGKCVCHSQWTGRDCNISKYLLLNLGQSKLISLFIIPMCRSYVEEH